MQAVSLKTAALALVPVIAWIVFLFLFVTAYHAIVHLQGRAAVILGMLRTLVELVTVVIALRYCFEILRRGAAKDLSVDRKNSA